MGSPWYSPGDVSDEDDVKGYVTHVFVDTWGKIDILVNCAGILGGKSVLDYELADFNRQLLVNCTGNFLNTRHVGHAMIDTQVKGSIICVASSAAWTGQPNNIGYCTSKGGIVNFVRAAAMDLSPNSLASASTASLQSQPSRTTPSCWLRYAAAPTVAQTCPLWVRATPTDYGHMLAFLASDYARLITGRIFASMAAPDPSTGATCPKGAWSGRCR